MGETTVEGRKLGPLLATVIVAGNMIGSGIYLLPATLGAIGSISLLGWILAALGAVALAAAFAALAQLRQADGGLVGYARDSLGRFAGFQTGFLYWVTCVVGNVAIALAVTGYAAYFLPVLKETWAQAAATVAVLWLITLAAILGPRATGRFGATTLAVGLAPVLIVGVLGWIWFDPAVLRASWNVSGQSAPLAVQASVVSVFWAFLGLESANAVAAVVRDPERNVPLAALGGVALAAAIYIAAITAIMGIVPASELAQSTAPFAVVVEKILGPLAAAAIAVCALLKASGTLAGWVLVTAQTMRAGAEEGVFPTWLAHARSDGTPVRSLLVMGVIMTLLALLTLQPTLGKQFGVLTDVCVVISLAVYGLCLLGLWRFANDLEGGRRVATRLIAAAALAFCVWIAAASGPAMLGMTAAVAALGGALWLVALRRLRLSAA